MQGRSVTLLTILLLCSLVRTNKVSSYVSPFEGFLKTVLDEDGGVLPGMLTSVTKPFLAMAKISSQTPGYGNLLNSLKELFQLPYPGTLWCTTGKKPRNERHIGIFGRTDECCRAHNDCGPAIHPGESYGRLHNKGGIKRYNCTCDMEFYKCLKDAHSIIASRVGVHYFNLLRPQCLMKEYPATCTKKDNRLRFSSEPKCVEYSAPKFGSMIDQWFDNPDF